jgi:hypothetical protein
MTFSNEIIQAMIYKIRGQNVMLDSDLAKLYVTTATWLRERKNNKLMN